MSPQSPLVLIILDGFGLSAQDEGNAVRHADIPRLKHYFQHYRWGVLEAAGMAVGVSWGEVGNSEVGHLGIGAGQVVYQNLPRIQLAMEDKSFYQNKEFLRAIQFAREQNGALHLMGLASPGGVHAHIEHLEALLDICSQQKFTNAFIHFFTDGRDTAPNVALDNMKQIQAKCKAVRLGRIATIAGRFWAMDRNNTWDRTQKAYEAIVNGNGPTAQDPLKAIETYYNQNILDEQIPPTVIVDEHNNAVGKAKEGDAFIFFNFREDRARQLTQAFVGKNFNGFQRSTVLTNILFVTMMDYEQGLVEHVAFPPQIITTPLGKVIAEQGFKQLRIAETEKYAHVTYFFNGGGEEPFPNEERALVESKKVESYAKLPEMSANEITERLLKELDTQQYAFVLVNYANPDMVGHTGDYDATLKALGFVDECVDRVAQKIIAMGGTAAITADHGNAEQKHDPQTGNPAKEHTANPVPFLIIDEARKNPKTPEELEARMLELTPIGILADVAPTLLSLSNISVPKEMTGRSLLDDLL